MAQVAMPQRKQGSLGTILQIGGAIVGSAGGFTGAAAGASAGKAAAGILDAPKSEIQAAGGGQSGAMQRRLMAQKNTQNLRALRGG